MSGLACPPPHHHPPLPTAWLPPAPLPPAPLPAQTSCPPLAAPGRAGGHECIGTPGNADLAVPQRPKPRTACGLCPGKEGDLGVGDTGGS